MHVSNTQKRTSDMIFATASDAGGGATSSDDKAQLAWRVYAADSSLSTGARSRVTPLAWRSHRAKRAIPSTLAGEVESLSGALAKAAARTCADAAEK